MKSLEQRKCVNDLKNAVGVDDEQFRVQHRPDSKYEKWVVLGKTFSSPSDPPARLTAAEWTLIREVINSKTGLGLDGRDVSESDARAALPVLEDVYRRLEGVLRVFRRRKGVSVTSTE
jgi:hypothetical protein